MFSVISLDIDAGGSGCRRSGLGRRGHGIERFRREGGRGDPGGDLLGGEARRRRLGARGGRGGLEHARQEPAARRRRLGGCRLGSGGEFGFRDRLGDNLFFGRKARGDDLGRFGDRGDGGHGDGFVLRGGFGRKRRLLAPEGDDLQGGRGAREDRQRFRGVGRDLDHRARVLALAPEQRADDVAPVFLVAYDHALGVGDVGMRHPDAPERRPPVPEPRVGGREDLGRLHVA
jgi:hypothetical protein